MLQNVTFIGVANWIPKDLHEQRRFWRLALMLIALSIVLFSVAFTYKLARQIEEDEKQAVIEMAKAYGNLISSTDENVIEESLELIQKNSKIPVIWTSAEGEPYDYKNIDTAALLQDEAQLNKFLEKLKDKNQVVPIEIVPGEAPQLLYYAASDLLQQVKIYPYVLLALVILFLLITFLAFSISRTAEQNQLWVGMAKETAHQLGTPISSLSAWLELLEDKLQDEEGQMIRQELQKDISRLEIVADRFSKIGSSPSLEEIHLLPIVEKIVDYMANRASREIKLEIFDQSDGEDTALLNPPLFEWVLENLIKNALDAMGGTGFIHVSLSNQQGFMVLEVKDSGKGIASGKFKAVFEPGYSTKLRGWGLGLTLSKRIIEQYHGGKIFVKESTIGEGTTFRIQLLKQGD